MVDAIALIRQRHYAADALSELLSELSDGHRTPESIAEKLVGQPITYFSIKTAMNDLEALAEHNEILGILLMTGLHGLADGVYAHDVCDGIELWIENSHEQNLVDALETITPTNEAAQKKKLEWLRMLRNR